MHWPRFGRLLVLFVAVVGGLTPKHVFCAVANSLILNEANTVSGGKFLDNGNKDTAFGRVEGNGQNWLEFLVVQGDEVTGGGFKNTLDLRGWTLNWSFDKDNAHTSYGAGTIQFTQDPLWAAVPRGTMITISEWKDAWYTTSSAPSYVRAGGFNGLGHLVGAAYNESIHTKLGATQVTPQNTDPQLLATNTYWNPGANGGGASGDWNIHVFAGDGPIDSNHFKYFNFTGSSTDGAIGTDAGGLFAVNNDNWQYTIKDQQLNVIQGPIGEGGTGLGSTWNVNSMEILRLEGPFNGDRPQSAYLSATINDYNDGSESTFGKPNVWSAGAGHQGLAGLRNWLQMGDADLDGAVTAADYVIWRKNFNTAGSWLQGDFSGNGIVDSVDYDIWRAHFGDSSLAGAPLAANNIPEPQTCALLAWSIFLLTSRRTNRHTQIQNVL